MSAFEVDWAHIDALLTAGMRGAPRGGRLRWSWGNPGREGMLTLDTADQVGGMLAAANRRGVNRANPGHDPAAPEPTEPYVYRRAGVTGGWPAILKAVDCLEYQSCDAPDWAGSEARAFCEALRRHAIRELDGYRAAPYLLTERNVTRL